MYELNYYDECEVLIFSITFDDMPTQNQVENCILGVDVAAQAHNLRALMKADGEDVSFVGEDDEGYQSELYYAQLVKKS